MELLNEPNDDSLLSLVTSTVTQLANLTMVQSDLDSAQSTDCQTEISKKKKKKVKGKIIVMNLVTQCSWVVRCQSENQEIVEEKRGKSKNYK